MVGTVNADTSKAGELCINGDCKTAWPHPSSSGESEVISNSVHRA